VLYGVVLAALVTRLDRSYPDLGRRPRALLAYTPLLALLLPPLFIVPAVAVAVAVLAHDAPAFARRWRSVAVDRIGRSALALAGVAGSAWVGTGVVDIVTR